MTMIQGEKRELMHVPSTRESANVTVFSLTARAMEQIKSEMQREETLARSVLIQTSLHDWCSMRGTNIFSFCNFR